MILKNLTDWQIDRILDASENKNYGTFIFNTRNGVAVIHCVNWGVI